MRGLRGVREIRLQMGRKLNFERAHLVTVSLATGD